LFPRLIVAVRSECRKRQLISVSMIVFLGGTGDIGSSVVPRLRLAGHQVIAPTSLELDLTNGDAVASFFGSLGQNYGLIFAAFIDRRRGETRVEFELNQLMVSNVMNHSNPSWCVFFSSIVVYGESPQLPINEDSMLAGEGLYSKAKQVAEHKIADAAEGRLPCLTVRFPGVFGGRARRQQSLDRILSTGLKIGEIALGGNGNVLRDWVSAAEVSEFLILNAANPRNAVVNFIRGESVAIDEYVAIALEVIPNISHRRANSGEESKTNDFVFDASRLQTLFPEWRFPPRERDIQELARELKSLHEQPLR